LIFNTQIFSLTEQGIAPEFGNTQASLGVQLPLGDTAALKTVGSVTALKILSFSQMNVTFFKSRLVISEAFNFFYCLNRYNF